MRKQVGTIKELWRYPVKSMEGEIVQQAHIESIGLVGDRYWAVRDDAAGELSTVRKLPRLLQCSARFEREPGAGQTGAEVPHVNIRLPDGSNFSSSGNTANSKLSSYLGRAASLHPLQPKSNADFYRLASTAGEKEMKKQFDARGGMPSLGSLSWSKLIELAKYVTPRGTFYDVYPLHIVSSNSIEKLKALEPDGDFQSRRFRPNIYIESTEKDEHLDEFDWVGGKLFIGDVIIKCESRTVRCSMPAQPQPGMGKDSKVLRTLDNHTERHLGINASVVQRGTVRLGDPVYWQSESRFSPRRFLQPFSDQLKNALIQQSLKSIDKKAK